MDRQAVVVAEGTGIGVAVGRAAVRVAVAAVG